MILGDYHLTKLLDAGPDGTRYEARRTDGLLAQVLVLDRACRHTPRWQRLSQRLRHLAQIDHIAARKIHALSSESDSPWIAVEPLAGASLPVALVERPKELPTAECIGAQLAALFVAAHRLGFVDGELEPCIPRFHLT